MRTLLKIAQCENINLAIYNNMDDSEGHICEKPDREKQILYDLFYM